MKKESFSDGDIPESLRRAIEVSKNIKDRSYDIVTLASLEEDLEYLQSRPFSNIFRMTPEERDAYYQKSDAERDVKQTRIRQALSDVRKAYGRRSIIQTPEWLYEGILFNASSILRLSATGLHYLHESDLYRVIYSPEDLELVKESPVFEFRTDKYRSPESIGISVDGLTKRISLQLKGIRGATSVKQVQPPI